MELAIMDRLNDTITSFLAANSPMEVADKLLGASLLPRDVHSKLIEESSDSLTRARRITTAVTLKVKAQSTDINKFIEILKKFESLIPLATILENKLNKSLIAKQVASPKELSASTTEPDNVKPNIPVSEPNKDVNPRTAASPKELHDSGQEADNVDILESEQSNTRKEDDDDVFYSSQAKLSCQPSREQYMGANNSNNNELEPSPPPAIWPGMIKNLEKEFRGIRTQFREFVESDRKNINTFFDFLKDPSDSWTGLENFFTENDLDHDDDLTRIFTKLKYHAWNFIDCDFLSTLITECDGPVQLKSRMIEYEKRVDSLCENITVEQLVTHWNPPVFSQDIPESFKTSVAKMQWDPRECKVQKLRTLQSRFKALLIPQKTGMAAYILAFILNKSVAATWLIFSNVWPQLMNRVRELIQQNSDFIEEFQISVFIIDDYIVYPCTDQEELWNASRRGASGVLRTLLEDAHANPNRVYEIFHRTALQCAAKYGEQTIAELLLDYGANINYQDMRGNTAVMIAVRAGQADMVKYLLNRGADVTIQENVCGMSPLLAAVDRNDLKSFELCKHNDLFNVKNKNGKTALILAAERRNEEIVRSLQSEGEQVIETEAQDVHGQTALHVAVKYGYTKIVEDLIKYPQALSLKDENKDTPRDIAEKNKQMEVVDLFKHYFGEDGGEESSAVESHEIGSYDVTPQEEDEPRCIDTSEGVAVVPHEEGAGAEPVAEEPDPRTAEQKQESGGRLRPISRAVFQSVIHGGTLNFRLVRAATNGSTHQADKLLRKGADPNAKGLDTQRWTALMWATYKGHLEVVQVLLSHGADPNKSALVTGYTAIIMASQKGYHEIMECLLDPKNPVRVDIEAMNANSDWGPLMWASQTRGSSEAQSEKGKENRRKVVKHLINAGADINKPAGNGWTPLMQASQDNHLELVQMLCQVDGINLDHSSDSSWTAITIACRKGKRNEQIVMELTKAGADVNIKKKGGVTALHIACFKNLIEAVLCMVPSFNADVNVQDNWGVTPLMYAIKQDHSVLAKYLIIEAGADVNIRAMKYAQWTAVFFAIDTGNQELFDILVDHKADMDIVDKNNLSPVAFSKGLFQEKKLYKHIMKQQELLQQHQEQAGVERSKLPSGKAYNALDFANHTRIEAFWNARQRINITWNIP